MKLLNHLYEDMPSLHTFVEDHFHPQDHILIQLFFGDLDAQKIQAILDYLHESLPQSVLIGSTRPEKSLKGRFGISTSFSRFVFWSTPLLGFIMKERFPSKVRKK